MSLDGYIGAPPTVTVFSLILPLFIILSCAWAGAIRAEVRVSVPKAAANKAMRLDMEVSRGVAAPAVSPAGGRQLRQSRTTCAVDGRATAGCGSGFAEKFFVKIETFDPAIRG